MATTAPSDVPVRSLQDILTPLQRHPEWRTALRRQLLGDELLELPALFAKFAAETTRRLDLLTQELAATNERLRATTASGSGSRAGFIAGWCYRIFAFPDVVVPGALHRRSRRTRCQTCRGSQKH